MHHGLDLVPITISLFLPQGMECYIETNYSIKTCTYMIHVYGYTHINTYTVHCKYVHKCMHCVYAHVLTMSANCLS